MIVEKNHTTMFNPVGVEYREKKRYHATPTGLTVIA